MNESTHDNNQVDPSAQQGGASEQFFRLVLTPAGSGMSMGGSKGVLGDNKQPQEQAK